MGSVPVEPKTKTLILVGLGQGQGELCPIIWGLGWLLKCKMNKL